MKTRAKNRIAKRKARRRARVAGCPPGEVTCGSTQPGDPPICCPAGDDPGFDIAEHYENVRAKRRESVRQRRR